MVSSSGLRSSRSATTLPDLALILTNPRPCPHQNLNVAIINSEAISGWEPLNKMWPTFRSNAKMLVEELSGSNKGYHLKADNEDAIREAFAQVASMMGGMNEAL